MVVISVVVLPVKGIYEGFKAEGRSLLKTSAMYLTGKNPRGYGLGGEGGLWVVDDSTML